jgi:sulfite reductase alpha subunit-like flavoprotein
LDLFPSVQLDFASFYQIAPLNAPRYYTVSSSRRLDPDTVSITLGLRKLASQPTPRCSSYLASLEPGTDSVRATFFQSSFVFPHGDRRPLMLISAGTGIAPFRAFLQDLEHEQEASDDKNHRQAYLFYGCRRRELDFLYGDDIARAHERGYLDDLFVEFSDSPNQPKRVRSRTGLLKLYSVYSFTGSRPDEITSWWLQHVQDALAEQGALVARHLLEHDGYVFVCGSLAMGRAVKRTIVDALREHGHFPTNQRHKEDPAAHFLTASLETGRIVTELW